MNFDSLDLPAHRVDSCLIIGAGMAGLTAAHALQDAGVRVRVLDKGRGVGGRMATRRIGDAVFDHGAQFITARDPRFRASIQGWLEEGVAKKWSRGFPSADGEQPSDGHSRFRGHPGMTSIPKKLAKGIDIRLAARIQAAAPQAERWQVVTESGELFDGDALVMTPPVPQSLHILGQGCVALPGPVEEQLQSIAYHRCIAVLAVSAEPTRLPSPGAMRFENGNIRWMTDNQQKGISPHAVAVTIHAAPEFSLQHWESEDAVIVDRLLAEAAAWAPGPWSSFAVHRWRYSQPVENGAVPQLMIPGLPPLIFAGDAFYGGRVEGAALSGWRAAAALS